MSDALKFALAVFALLAFFMFAAYKERQCNGIVVRGVFWFKCIPLPEGDM